MSTDEIKSTVDLNRSNTTLFVLWGISPAILMVVSGLISIEVEGFLPMALSALVAPVILFPWSLRLLKHASVTRIGKILLALLLTVVFTFANVMLGVSGCAFVATMIGAVINTR